LYVRISEPAPNNKKPIQCVKAKQELVLFLKKAAKTWLILRFLLAEAERQFGKQVKFEHQVAK